MVNRIFTITNRILNARKTNGSPVICYTCKVLLKSGDLVITKTTSRGLKSPIRHESCAKRINII